jgi:hypothetical protein
LKYEKFNAEGKTTMKTLTKKMMLQISLAVSSGMLVLADPAPVDES